MSKIIKRTGKIFVKEDWHKNTRDHYNSGRLLMPEHSMIGSGKYPVEIRVTMERIEK